MTSPARAVRALVERHPGPAALKFSYVSAFVAFGLIRHDDRVWSYIFVITVLLVTVGLIHGVAQFSRPITWALAVSGALHMAGGIMPSWQRGAPILYDTWLVEGLLKYDQLVHFVGTAVLTVAAWELLAHFLDLRRATAAGHAALAAMMGVACGAINEVYEFLSAQRFSGLHIGGFDNMGWDLVFNLAGAVATAVFLGISQLPAPVRPTTASEVSKRGRK